MPPRVFVSRFNSLCQLGDHPVDLCGGHVCAMQKTVGCREKLFSMLLPQSLIRVHVRFDLLGSTCDTGVAGRQHSLKMQDGGFPLFPPILLHPLRWSPTGSFLRVFPSGCTFLFLFFFLKFPFQTSFLGFPVCQ